MTKQQAAELFNSLLTNYKNWNPESALWINLMIGYDFKDVAEQVKKYLTEHVWPPKVADIIGTLSPIKQKDIINDIEESSLVYMVGDKEFTDAAEANYFIKQKKLKKEIVARLKR